MDWVKHAGGTATARCMANDKTNTRWRNYDCWQEHVCEWKHPQQTNWSRFNAIGGSGNCSGAPMQPKLRPPVSLRRIGVRSAIIHKWPTNQVTQRQVTIVRSRIHKVEATVGVDCELPLLVCVVWLLHPFPFRYTLYTGRDDPFLWRSPFVWLEMPECWFLWKSSPKSSINGTVSGFYYLW